MKKVTSGHRKYIDKWEKVYYCNSEVVQNTVCVGEMTGQTEGVLSKEAMW